MAERSSMVDTKSAAAAATSDKPMEGGWEVLPKVAGELEVRLSGRWTVATGAQSAAGLASSLPPGTRLISFDTRDLSAWDSVLIDFLCKLESLAEAKKIEVDRSGLPSGAVRLVALARAVPERRAPAAIRPGSGGSSGWERARSNSIGPPPIFSRFSAKRASPSADW